MEKYLDSTLSPAERAADLLSRMTREEKLKQIQCRIYKAGEGDLKDGMGEIFVEGLLEHVTPENTAAAIRQIQEECMNSSRFRIPAIVHNEALSGVLMEQASSFPTSISLGASFSPDTVQDMMDRVRRQMVSVGFRHALSPVLDIPRDLRWGRVSETYGNDPTLSAAMSVAFVKGLQTDDLKNGASATGKHFLAYSQTEGGLNMNKSVVDERDLREVFAKPFEAAIRLANLGTIMNSYSEVNGRPVCASKKILTDLLRDDLGFTGPVVSDYGSIERLVFSFRTAEDLKEAAAQCLEAGLDLECPNPLGYAEPLQQALEEGRVTDELLDRACLRILKFKFELGLFENCMPRDEMIKEAFRNPAHKEANLKAAEKVMTLTKNNGILPLTDKKLKVAVIGPTGNGLRFLYSGYTYTTLVDMNLGRLEMIGTETPKRPVFDPLAEKGFPKRTYPFSHEQAIQWMDARIRKYDPEAKTIFEAIREEFPDAVYVEGCSFLNPEKTDFDTAVAAAAEADLVFLTVGAKCGWGAHSNHAEGLDTRNIGLPASQNELARRVLQAAKKCVVIHTDARPLVHTDAYEKADAILETWLPNTYGAAAVVNTLLGKNNPAGRLPFDVPYDEGMIPYYHYQHNGSHEYSGGATAGLYGDAPKNLHRPFGFGLSYTTFEYSNMQLTSDGKENPVLNISVDVKNTGDRSGDEVVQLYARDLIGSVIRPYQELAGFKRITLEPGQTKTVNFRLQLDQLAFRDEDGNWILEAGDFAFYIGPDSRTRKDRIIFRQEKTVAIDYTKRGFYAEATVK